jgi:sulfide:quinone oxidoreductase
MAAARKQAPVVAENVISALYGRESKAAYDGYGSCPLTVERGKVILAEFGYNGKLLPSFPRWMNDGTRATRFGWFLKDSLLPVIYYQLMLKGREWLARPNFIEDDPVEEVGVQA